MGALFGTNSIKLPYFGGSYKEINDSLRTAFKYNSDIKTIIRGLDMSCFLMHIQIRLLIIHLALMPSARKESEDYLNKELSFYTSFDYGRYILGKQANGIVLG